MSTKKERITKGLKEIGSCWAGSRDRYICTNHNCCQPLDGDKKAYHIHPDAEFPYIGSIKKFYTLDEIQEFIDAVKSANECGDDSKAFEIMEDYWASRVI